MRQFIKKIKPLKKTTDAKVQAILDNLFKTPARKFTYNDLNTLTAAEAFRQRKGNCLSFSAVFISLARQMGLNAKFNEVNIPVSWGEQNENTFILYRHINASVKKSPSVQTIVDIAQDLYQTSYPQSTIPDEIAEAQYFNNIATEYMAKNDSYQAFRYLKKALDINPEASYLWSNLGTLYRREKHLNEAESAFHYALLKDPENMAAISSLQRLYEHTGKLEIARELTAKAEKIRLKNPYYLYRKAVESFRLKNYELAQKQIKEAINRSHTEHRFYFILAAIQMLGGQQNKGERTMKKAIKLAENQKIKTRYGQKLKFLQSLH